MALEAFLHAGTVPVSASMVTANALLPGGGDTLLIYNTNNGIAFVALGSTATTAGYLVPAGGSRLLKCGPVATQVAVILATGSTSGPVYVSQGTGSNY